MPRDTHEELRTRAEARIQQRRLEAARRGELDPHQLLAELELHQVELEMQNEELRSAHEELEKSRARYAELFEMAPIPYITLDDQGLVLDANSAACALLGQARRSVVRRPLRVHVAEKSRDLFFAHHHAVTATRTPQSCELMLLTVHGPRHVRMDSAPWRTPNDRQCLVTLVDVTQRRAMEDQLLESEERSRRLLDGMVGHAVLGLDVDGMVRSANPGAELLLGYRAPELVGRPFAALWGVRQEGAHLPLIKQAEREGHLQVQARWFRRDGQPVDVQLAVARTLDPRGMPTGFVCVGEDATKLRKAISRAAQDAQVETLKRAAAHITGSLGAPLSAALLSAAAGGMDRLARPLMAIADFAQQWQVLSTPGSAAPAAMRVRSLVEAVLARLGPGAPVDILPIAETLAVDVDPALMTMALTAVVGQAVQSSPPGKRAEVTVSEIEVRNPALPLRDGAHVRICIRDHGPGTPVDISRVEEGLVGGRPGLDMHAAALAVKRHGGAMVVDGRPGEGTWVFIYLPSSGTPASALRTSLRGLRVALHPEDPQLESALRAFLAKEGVEVCAPAAAQVILVDGAGPAPGIAEPKPVVRIGAPGSGIALAHPFGPTELTSALLQASATAA